MRKLAHRLSALLLLAWAAPARADSDSDLEALLNQTVVTTASKTAETGSTAPATSSTITAEDIRNYGIHSLDEAINFLSLGAFAENAWGDSDVGARGVVIPNDQGGHFLLLVNGHAINEPLFGAARFGRGAGIPIELVDRIEVVLGPGSVLYGNNAMLGVINVVTKNARDFKGTRVVLESELGKSVRAAAGAGYELKLFGSQADLTTAVEYYRQRGPGLTVGPQPGWIDGASFQLWRWSRNGPATGVWGGVAGQSLYADIPAGHLRLAFHDLEINLHASLYKRATPFNHRFINPDSDFDDPNNYEMDRSAWADVKYTKVLSRWLQIGARLYADTFDYQRYTDGSGGEECRYPVATCRHSVLGVSRWYGVEAQATLDWMGDGRLATLVGVDARARYVGSRTDIQDFDTGSYLASSDGLLSAHDGIFGAYLQQTWRPGASVDVNAGGRLDYDGRYGYQASPRLAIAAPVWRGGTLKAVYSEAFRAPSWAESNRAVGVQLAAENLRPETVRSVEASVEQKIGAHRLFFGAFASKWTDLVELHVYSPEELEAARTAGQAVFTQDRITQNRNLSAIDNVGWNASYEGALADSRVHYAVNGTATVTSEHTEAGAHPLPIAPRVFGNARFSYALPERWPTLGIAAYYLARRPADRAFDGSFTSTPYAPDQVELRGTVSGQAPFLPKLSYQATASYVFGSNGAYVVGPRQGTTLGQVVGPAELVPVDRFRVTIGGQYAF